MASEWFVKIDNSEQGPMSASDLKSLADSGQLCPNHLVKKGVDGSWTSASKVKGLFPSPPNTQKSSTVVPPPPPIRTKPDHPPKATIEGPTITEGPSIQVDKRQHGTNSSKACSNSGLCGRAVLRFFATIIASMIICSIASFAVVGVFSEATPSSSDLTQSILAGALLGLVIGIVTAFYTIAPGVERDKAQATISQHGIDVFIQLIKEMDAKSIAEWIQNHDEEARELAILSIQGFKEVLESQYLSISKYIPTIRRLLENVQPSVRTFAARSLGEIGAIAGAALPCLRQLAAQDADVSVREAAARAIEKMFKDDAVLAKRLEMEQESANATFASLQNLT